MVRGGGGRDLDCELSLTQPQPSPLTRYEAEEGGVTDESYDPFLGDEKLYEKRETHSTPNLNP